jgi:hypothetical protein
MKNPNLNPKHRLLCEGSSDIFFIANLKDKLNVQVRPTGEPISASSSGEGIDFVYQRLPNLFLISDVQSIGVVVDADSNLQLKYDRIKEIVFQSTKDTLPPVSENGIVAQFEKIRFGLWFWPDNQRNGDLESLLHDLIPVSDKAFAISKSAVQSVLENNLTALKEKDRRKAEIYNWLSLQKEPGRPIGQSVANGTFQLGHPVIQKFKTWLQNLYTND